MNAKIIPSACLLLASVATALPIWAKTASPSDIIPRPAQVKIAKGVFQVPDGFDPDQVPVKFTAADGESYRLVITPKTVRIEADGKNGAFYARQSLRQMLQGDSVTALQCATVADSPRFPWRGMHFDVSRHFRSVDFLKKQIDAMAALKLNKMHLHLTDGAGWRMQIDRYPRLTSYAAWRPQAVWQDWVDNGARYCDSSDVRASGGFYTKQQLRDIVAYAAERGIEVIPEIEMPGHSEEVIAAYPQLACAGADNPGSDFCPGKEATFEFLQNVLDEVIEVFPSQYIHIGGDEASKANWSNCSDCRKRMADQDLDGVDELQSYLIERIERYLNAKGRRIIGWDEILQGGVAPNATVMSWRGTEGGLQALRSGHDVIMTPGEFCYLDYCQDAPFKEPISIGGFTPLEKVYSYEPLEPGIEPGQASHLLGLQGNLWAEYIPTDQHAEYMYYPRLYAIAEIGWSAPGKDYPDFRRRALRLNSIMKSRGYTPFNLADEYGERRESLTPIDHKGVGATVSYLTPYSDKYKAAGPSTLTDGIRGGWTYGDRRWQGFSGPFEAIVDLGKIVDVNYAGATFMHAPGAWVHFPPQVQISLSTDGVNFTDPVTLFTDVDPQYPKIMFKDYGSVFGTQARFVRISAPQHSRPGAWLFVDEIVVN